MTTELHAPVPPPLSEDEWHDLLNRITEEQPPEPPRVVIIDQSDEIPVGSLLIGQVVGALIALMLIVGGVL